MKHQDKINPNASVCSLRSIFRIARNITQGIGSLDSGRIWQPILYPLILMILTGLLIIPSWLYAETPVSGHIDTDTAWTKAGSPYIVTGTVSVYGDTTIGPTLTIEPGVEILFNQGACLKIGEGANRGALIATGTEDEPIVFTANSDNPSRGFGLASCFTTAPLIIVPSWSTAMWNMEDMTIMAGYI